MGTGPVWGLAPVGRGRRSGNGRRVNVVEYYTPMNGKGKMRCVETIPGMEEGIKGNGGGVNSSMTDCKNFCKCHNGPQDNNAYIYIYQPPGSFSNF
jgi:hypothetical protein